MDIIHRPAFYLKHDVLEIGLCLRLQVEPTQLLPIDRASLCLLPNEIGSTWRRRQNSVS
jgi:hypothetical protein